MKKLMSWLFAGGAFLVILAFWMKASAARPGSVPGDILFTDSGQSLGNEWSNDVALGDLDGDTDLDAFVVNSTPASEVWINQGGTQGGTPGVYLDSGQVLTTTNGGAVALGDLDGDSDLDAFVVLAFGTDSHQAWINQGGDQGGTPGVFQRNAFTADDGFGTNVVLGDVDGDTDLDAYVPRIFNPDLVYLNNGSGLFTDSGQALEAADSLGAALADLDGDGDLDVFVAVNNGANTVWLNQGGLQGGTEGVFLDSGQTLGSRISMDVALGDVDNDLDLDAFVANATENIVWINQGGLQGGTPGLFQDNGQTLGFSASQDVKLADFDNDNDLDAFVAEAAANTVWVNQGGDQGGTIGTFADSGQALGNAFSQGVSLGDVDGDSDVDAFVSNSGPAPNKVYLNDSSPAAPPINPEGWQLEMVDTRGLTGRHTSLALDSNARPHISYVATTGAGTHPTLYHSYWDGVRWHKTIVDEDPLFAPTATAVDSQGTIHILYTKASGPSSPTQLYYAFGDGATWQTQVVNGNITVDTDISMAVDSLDRPHIGYVVKGNPIDDLQHAVWDGATWQTETVESKVSPQWESLSLALDASDQPHISYFAGDENELRYATNDGGGWQLQTVDAPPFIFSSKTSIAVDGNNQPQIAYTIDSEALAYALWDGAAWQIQTVLDVFGSSNQIGNLSLALDSADHAHISYAYDLNGTDLSLRHIQWTGVGWENEILDDSGNAGFYNAIAIDSLDQMHVAYYTSDYGDLRYLHWGPNWQIRSVPDSGQIQAVDLDMDEGSPQVVYYNASTTLFNRAEWDTDWDIQPITSIGNPISDASVINIGNRQFASFYDADNQRLLAAVWDGNLWTIRVIDNQGDVGSSNQIVPIGTAGLQVGIAYWDATNHQIKLALYSILDNTVEIYPHTLQPPLTADPDQLSATSSSSGDVAVSYWDDGNQSLRYAVWDKQSTSWVMDEVVDTFAGQINALQSDGLEGVPVIAYYDALNDALLLAYRDESGWQVETAVPNAGTVSSLDLELGFQSRLYPRLAYTTATDSRFGHKEAGAWTVEIIDENIPPSGGVALTLDQRPHLAYPYGNSGLAYIFRTATLDMKTGVPGAPSQTGGGYNYAFSPCGAIVDLFLGTEAPGIAGGPSPPGLPVLGIGPLNDEEIFGGLAALFGGSTAGQQYIDLYFIHATEMGQIGLNDPLLFWDGFGTLQNFLPGLEALVTGRGNEVIVTQQMVDDALDIWQRLAAAGSPELAGMINSELATYNNLQDFVGLTFEEWAETLGVPVIRTLALPIITR